MHRIIILSVLFLFAFPGQFFAQDEEVRFTIDGRLTSDGGNTDGATITISKDGQQQEIVTPPRTGKFFFKFDFNHEYRLNFNCEGYFQKIIIISTFVPTEVLQRNNKFPPLSFELNLFQETDIIDRSFSIKPVARVFYNAKIDNFDSEIYLSDDQLRKQIQAAEAARDALAAERRSIGRADEMEQAALEKQYDKTIADADALYHKNDYEGAISKFREARMLFSDRPYPKDRIAEIEDLLAALKMTRENEQNYLAAIKAGDEQFDATQYGGAITSYEKALEFKAKDKYATTRIAESRKLLIEKQGNMQYNGLIARADSAFNNRIFVEAKDLYQQAIDMRPRDSQHARDRIREIDRTLALLADQAALEKQYAGLILQGDAAFNSRFYGNAITSYEAALKLKPGESYPTDQIAKAFELFAEQLRTDQLKRSYLAYISMADSLFRLNAYQPARSNYTDASRLRPSEQYPKDKIAEIDAILAEQQHQKVVLTELNRSYEAAIKRGDDAFQTKDFETAIDAYSDAHLLKREEEYPVKQLAEIKRLQEAELAAKAELDAQYNQVMASAKSYFEQDMLDNALTDYKRAAVLKPQEPEPPQRIGQIEQLKAQRAEDARLAAEAEARRIAAEKASKENYDAAIALGDASLKQKAYTKAQDAYTNALTIFPKEQYPKDKLAEIDNILQQLAQAEAERRQKARGDSIAAANLVAFNLKIREAETFIDDQKLENAITSYREAIGILPEKEPEVQPKIDELEELIARLAKIEADYQATIQKADEQFNSEAWNDAKSSYLQAINLKPEESYPKDQIEKIDLKLQELELLAERARTNEKITSAYNEAIKIADENFDKKDYTVAQFYYRKALGMQPENPYPKQRMDEISQLIDQSLAEGQLKEYNDAIAKADMEFDRNGYTLAKFYYNKALAVKSWEQHPKDRLAEIGKLTNTLLSEREEQEYLNWISTADEAFIKKEYSVARTYYQRALALKNDEPYPSIKLNEIQKALENLQAEQTEKEYRASITEADKAFESKNYSVARFYYNKAIKLRPAEKYPKDQLQLIREAIGGN